MNLIIFPHQLYNVEFKEYNIYIVEDTRYFSDHRYHKLKLAYHRATMKKYYDKIKKYKPKYIEFDKVTNQFYKNLKEIYIYDPYDNILLKRLKKLVKVNILENKQFLISVNEINEIKNKIAPNKKYKHDIFYKMMRMKYNILVDDDKPIGGKWSFDTENRLKLPSQIKIPKLPKINKNEYIVEAIEYINKNFKDNYGDLDNFIYPIDHESSIKWLKLFLKERLSLFGKYEDAVSTEYDFIFHSVLSPMMNIGLLRDIEVLEISNDYYIKNKSKIPIASYEGFIRQLIGWRQYVYTLYVLEGETMRKSNLLDHKNKLNDKWWTSVNMTPVDFLINKIKKYSYAHHIERLMYLSNWLLLNQIKPNEVYRIFMEWTIDAYDWVMVPNVYGMGQSASDLMMTRLYFSSSNYILKMSNFKNDSTNWVETWDAVYYAFIKKHKKIISSNYATAMQAKHYDNKTTEQKNKIDSIANNYFKLLNQK
jgi:deoxyribodipyrimidine photolyase-related protein